jgi:hypothetical protein
VSPASASSDILCRIEEIIEQNGSVTQPTKDRLMLMAIAELLRRVDEVDKVKADCAELRRNSILIWVKAHPTLAGFLAVVALITWNSIKLILLEWLGLPVGLLP